MVHAQAALARDPDRSPPGLPRWEMHDWFVPVLFQEPGGDVRLLPEAGLPQAADVELVRRTARGKMPGAPAHGFVGRDRELLALSRLLHRHRVVLLRGTGGLGKTALAAECARWLLDVQRVRRLAWTSVETFGSAEAVLQDLGSQVVAGFAVSRFDSLEEARREVERALRDRPTLLVVDNFESVAADPDPALVPMLAALGAVGETHVLVTGREPAPTGLGATELSLGALGKLEGRALVDQVLRRGAQAPKEERGDPADGSWIDELVESVAGHPRSLVLLAPMVAGLGARVTREKLVPLMAELERRNPGDRENSLLASVRLSLARLEPTRREQVRALAVFHGAAHTRVLAQVLEVEPSEALALCRELVDLGLAEVKGPYLLPDPALGPVVADELSGQERERIESRWLKVSLAWVGFLYEQRSRDTSIAVTGVRHALGELLAVVAAVERAAEEEIGSIEEASGAVRRVEGLLESSRNPRALGLAVAARERLGKRLAGWSHAAFNTHRLAIERQRQGGDLAGALAGARALYQRAKAAGPGAHESAAYDLAGSAFLLAQVLNAAGRADESLDAATEAEAGFRVLAAAGDTSAANMAVTSLTERGIALTDLARLDEAAAAYEKVIEEADALGYRRAAALSRGELGTVRILQQRYPEAIAAWDQARRTFDDLDDLNMVAVAWHQIALVHTKVAELDAAERAYLRSLEIATRLGDRGGQAAALNGLGNIYVDAGRVEEAANHYRRAADLFATVGDQRGEGFARTNVAACLQRLVRHADARIEAQHAVELGRRFGHAAQPWTTWAILSDIEHHLGNTEGAAIARQQAIDTYAAYRRDGGYPRQSTGRLVAKVTAALAGGASPRALVSQFPPPAGAAPSIGAFFSCLRAILTGARDLALLADPALDFDDVAELTLLLERLALPSSP
jgi:tetratricopeptide (TPR) repeat protein